MERPSWDEYFMDLAYTVSKRATCPRKRVGALAVHGRRVLVTGYNGSLPGAPHCDDVGCAMEDGHCVRTVHAEANAVMQAAAYGVRLEGCTVYTTASPCWPCMKLLMRAGTKRIVYAEEYRGLVHAPGVEMVLLNAP